MNRVMSSFDVSMQAGFKTLSITHRIVTVQ